MTTSYLSWKRDLDRLKSQAIAKTEENPQPSKEARQLADTAKGKPLDAWMSSARAAVKEGLDTGLAPPVTCVVYGWFVNLSRTRVSDGRYSWHLSASLTPKGRRSSERDWQMLGKIAAHLGAPRDPMIVPENPNDVHHWQWFEQVT